MLQFHLTIPFNIKNTNISTNVKTNTNLDTQLNQTNLYTCNIGCEMNSKACDNITLKQN